MLVKAAAIKKLKLVLTHQYPCPFFTLSQFAYCRSPLQPPMCGESRSGGHANHHAKRTATGGNLYANMGKGLHDFEK